MGLFAFIKAMLIRLRSYFCDLQIVDLTFEQKSRSKPHQFSIIRPEQIENNYVD